MRLGQRQKSGYEQILITRHPNVRRMLLWMKAHVEGMRGLDYYTARSFDIPEITDDADVGSVFINFGPVASMDRLHTEET
jgi:alkylation response protein AidB-like acyl-CoA dehydrogenase